MAGKSLLLQVGLVMGALGLGCLSAKEAALPASPGAGIDGGGSSDGPRDAPSAEHGCLGCLGGEDASALDSPRGESSSKPARESGHDYDPLERAGGVHDGSSAEEQGESAGSAIVADVPLPPASEALGVRRWAPLLLAEGMDHDAPAVEVTSTGTVLVAFVSRASDDTETVMLRHAVGGPSKELGAPIPVSTGARAWNPVLGTGADGSGWLTWCGRAETDRPGDHDRAVYLRRVWPLPAGETVTVAGGPGRQCDPALDVAPDGVVHLAWESGDRVAWRSYSPRDEALSPAVVLSFGPLDRRPSLVATEERVYVAWDRLDLSRDHGLDPRYDVLLRSLARDGQETGGDLGEGWGPPIEVASGAGIQAAPSLARAPDGDGVLIAYHTSEKHPLVKWWKVRKVGRDGALSELALTDGAANRTPEGEQQGAELPTLAVDRSGRLAVVTRPSQGAYLHVVDSLGVSPPLDLTRRGWGARGARARAAFALDGTLLVARRARAEVVLERFTFLAPSAGHPPFRPVTGERERSSFARDVAPVPGVASEPSTQALDDARSDGNLSFSGLSQPSSRDTQSSARNVDRASSGASRPSSRDTQSAARHDDRASTGVSRSSSRDTQSAARHVDPALLKLDEAAALGSSFGEWRIVFGDVHMHSALSDGTGPADEIYARTWNSGLDFAVLTDHDYIVGSRMFPSKHAEIAWITDWFDNLEGFATLHGFEWTTPPVPRGHGHRNVYFRGHPMMPLPGSRDGYPSTRALNRALSGEKAFTAAHHTAWTGTDWENFDPAVQRHVEIVSVHGAFEREVMEDAPIPPRGEHSDGFAVRGLAAGHVFGFLGGSDSHGLLWHHGLARRPNPWDQGLTGVIVPKLGREDIWDSIHSRLTFATSGAKMKLLVSVSAVAMGQEGKTEGAPVVSWSYETTATPGYLLIVRDGEPVHRVDLEASAGVGSWTDHSAQDGHRCYYARLVQGEGEQGVDVAWSSPVFIEKRRR